MKYLATLNLAVFLYLVSTYILEMRKVWPGSEVMIYYWSVSAWNEENFNSNFTFIIIIVLNLIVFWHSRFIKDPVKVEMIRIALGFSILRDNFMLIVSNE